MATTSPDNLRTPDPGDPYNLVSDLATLAGDVQDALNDRGNAFKGTAAERAIAESSIDEGSLWVDTDGIKMIWRRGVSAFEPAVWNWSGTTTQMNLFTQAPDGFEWFNTSDTSKYLRLSGSWTKIPTVITASGSVSLPGGSGSVTSETVSFPAGLFTATPTMSVTANTSVPGTVEEVTFSGASTTGATIHMLRTNATATTVNWIATQVL